MRSTPLAVVGVLVLALAAAAGLCPPRAEAMASHVGWPPYEMLLMNKTDSSRPLDARPGMDPFGGRDPRYSCDELGPAPSRSCRPLFVPRGTGYVMTSLPASHRLLGGHGDDTIHAGPWGDVIWGDYKPCCQPTGQRDHLFGGAGPDFIYASHGRNVIRAGAGMDVIHGHFGHGTVDCGPGRDLIYVNGAHRHAYRLRHCEVVRTTTGVSAPGWVLRRLPWNRCATGTTYRYAACRAPGEHPESDISGVDLTARYDAGALAGRLASQACRLGPARTARAAGALAATMDALTALRTLDPALGAGGCGSASSSALAEHFDFQRLIDAYEPAVCRAGATGGDAAAGYRETAQQIVDDLVSRWRRGIHLRGLTAEQQQAVLARIDAATLLCGG